MMESIARGSSFRRPRLDGLEEKMVDSLNPERDNHMRWQGHVIMHHVLVSAWVTAPQAQGGR